MAVHDLVPGCSASRLDRTTTLAYKAIAAQMWYVHHSGCSFQMVKTMKSELCTGSCPARWLSVDKVLWKHSKWLIIVILVATVRLIKFGLPCFCRSKEAPRILWTSVGTLMPDHAPKKLFVRQSLDKAATAMTCRHVPCESTMIISHGLQIFVWLYRCYQFMSPCNLKIGSCLRKGRGYNNSSCSWRSGQASRYAFNVLTYLL